MLLERAYGFGSRGHVGPLGHAAAAVGHQRCGLLAVELVLSGARHGHVAPLAPRPLPGVVDGRRIAVGVFADAAAEDVLEFHDVFELCLVDAVGVVDVTRRVGKCHHAGSHLRGLAAGILGDVARARDADPFAAQRLAARGEHLFGKVADAVARRFGTHRAAAPVAALARERARKFVAQALVLSKQIADFASAHADVACRYVGILPDMALQFGHERLTELHHLVVRLALGVEVRTALAAAHGERRQAVLEGLLEGQEFQNREVDRRVEAQSALVGADGAVHLDAVAAVDFDFALVVEPRHAEDDDALGLGDSFENLHPLQYGTCHDVRGERFGHLADGLVKLRLARIAGDEPGHEILDELLCLFVHVGGVLRVRIRCVEDKISLRIAILQLF